MEKGNSMLKKILMVTLLVSLALGAAACTPQETLPPAPAETEEAPTTPPETEPPTQAPTEAPPTATPEPTDTPEPTPTATPRSILWEDDFSDVNSGWERYREMDGVLDYLEAEGVYQMQLLVEDNLFWVMRDETWRDLVLEVEMTQKEGPEGSLFGVMCRYTPETLNAIVFVITSEGQAGIGTMENFAFNPLPGGELAEFTAIQTGLDATNILEAGCVGETVSLGVNGEILLTLPAPEMAGDDLGLVVASTMGAGVNVYFDNLVIYEP
jgi:hypothetical protein